MVEDAAEPLPQTHRAVVAALPALTQLTKLVPSVIGGDFLSDNAMLVPLPLAACTGLRELDLIATGGEPLPEMWMAPLHAVRGGGLGQLTRLRLRDR